MRWGLLVALVVFARSASADSVVATSIERKHAVYLELFGKGGPWGIGYDHALGKRFAIGAVGSYSPLDDQRLLTLSPYVAAYPLGTGMHRWYVDAGPQIVHLATPSMVPEWDGTSETGIGAQLSSGYEYRGRLLVRLYGQVVAGKNGIAPWFGISLGWTL